MLDERRREKISVEKSDLIIFMVQVCINGGSYQLYHSKKKKLKEPLISNLQDSAVGKQVM